MKRHRQNICTAGNAGLIDVPTRCRIDVFIGRLFSLSASALGVTNFKRTIRRQVSREVWIGTASPMSGQTMRGSKFRKQHTVNVLFETPSCCYNLRPEEMERSGRKGKTLWSRRVCGSHSSFYQCLHDLRGFWGFPGFGASPSRSRDSSYSVHNSSRFTSQSSTRSAF